MTDLFNADQTQEPELDPNKNYLEELVGEGKKFKSPEELAKGKFYADQMIELQNKRFDEMRAEYLKVREENLAKAKLEDMINQISQQRLADSDSPQAKEDDKPVDFTKIEELVSNKIREAETSRKQLENFNLVQSKLRERFGANYSNVLKQETDKLGLTTDYVNTMARNQPEALLRLVGADRQTNNDLFQTPPRSNQRNDSFAPRGPEKRTWSYYQNMKRTDPTKYLARDTAIQMQQDAINLGSEFQDGDYFVKGLHE